MASKRDLRGFDAIRLRAALEALTLPVLRAALDAVGAWPRGPKPMVVRRTHALVEAGDLAVMTVFRTPSKRELRRACRAIELDDRGTIAALVARIDRAVRYAPLGDASAVDSMVVTRIDPSLAPRERLFVLELHARLANRSRGVSRFTLGELIGRLGRRRAVHRARASAAREVGEVLCENGFVTDPDLRFIERSPGIDATVAVSIRDDWLRRDAIALAGPAQGKRAGNGQLPAGREADIATSTLNHPADDVASSIAELGMAVSRSDNLIHESEVKKIHERLAQTRAHAGERQQLGELIERLRHADIDVELAASRIAERLDQRQRSAVLVHLFDVAMADGVVVPEEEAMLRMLNDALRPDPELFEELMAEYLAGAVTLSRLAREPQREGDRAVASRVSVAASHVKPMPPNEEPVAQIDEIIELLFAG